MVKEQCQILVEAKDGVTRVTLSGEIDDIVDFKTKLSGIKGEVHFYTKAVSRINSLGVKAWMISMQQLTQEGAKLKFYECSPSIVEQFNLIVNFGYGSPIESAYVPYVCPECNATRVALFSTADIKKMGNNPPEPPCPSCKKANMTFDDIPSEYFQFANRG